MSVAALADWAPERAVTEINALVAAVIAPLTHGGPEHMVVEGADVHARGDAKNHYTRGFMPRRESLRK